MPERFAKFDSGARTPTSAVASRSQAAVISVVIHTAVAAVLLMFGDVRRLPQRIHEPVSVEILAQPTSRPHVLSPQVVPSPDSFAVHNGDDTSAHSATNSPRITTERDTTGTRSTKSEEVRPSASSVRDALALPDVADEPGDHDVSVSPSMPSGLGVVGVDVGLLGLGKQAGTDTVSGGRAIKRWPRPLQGAGDMQLPYTKAAAAAAVRGAVVLQLSIDAAGRVSTASVIRGLGHGLDELALAVVQELIFEPALDMFDRPTAVQIKWSVHFEPPPSNALPHSR